MKLKKEEQNNPPFKLNDLVNVLPHPGTGQAYAASFFLLDTLASCVAFVVTNFFGGFAGSIPGNI